MTKKHLLIVDQIEKIRKLNNRNWMDLLRIALKFAPKEARLTLQKINKNDKKISKLFSKF
jgi:hypothetical protein